MKATQSIKAKLTLLYPTCRIIIHDEDGHYKFYCLDAENNRVIYGRIGQKPKSVKMHPNNYNWIESKIKEKIKKGYREI